MSEQSLTSCSGQYEASGFGGGEPVAPPRREAGDPLEAVMAAAFGPVSAAEHTVGITEGPGTVIGPYKLMEQIGQGGMGLVFVAEQLRPVRRKVAVKVLKPGMESRAVVARFEAERQALALMDHPHIARVLDAGQTPAGRPYFVMELVRGVPITDYCDRNRLTPHDRLQLFVDVCHAVQHAHNKGIIHRDLKPSNILVSSHDGTPVVKVIDFGVAKAIGQQLTDKTLYTHFTQFMGTPLYMSPEQAGQSGLDVDTRTDIYALGVVLYELLTGMTPFDQTRFSTAAYDEIRRIIIEEDPPRPSTRFSTLAQATATSLTANRNSDPHALTEVLRGELDWIVMKCLEKDRNRRFETVNALALDVLRFLNDEQVLACPPSAWYRFRKFARRHKAALASAAAIVMLVILAFVLLVISNVVVGRQQQETEKALASETRAKGDLEEALKRERRSLYFQRIARADLEWWACNVPRADKILDECPAEYRHWEWHYLKRLCHAEIRAFRGHTQGIRGLAFSPEGRRIASASDDRTVKVWNIDSKAAPLTLIGHQELVASVAFSPDGRRLASASGDWVTGKPGEVKIWDLASGKEILALTGHKAAVAGVAFSPDGRLIATAGWDWTLRIWDAVTGKQIRSLPHQGAVKCVAFSPDGSQVAGGTYDRLIAVWNVTSGRRVATLRGHTSSVLGVAFSPDGQRLVSAGWDHTARVWDVPRARELLVLRGHKEVVHGVAFSPDGQTVASVASDGMVRLWHSGTGNELFTLRHSGIVFAVAFSPGGRCLASSSSDRTVKLWDLTSNPQHRSFALADASRPRLALSADGRFLTAANRRPLTRGGSVHIRVLETGTGRQVLVLPEYPGGFNSVAFSPDGKQLACDWGASARTWDAQTGRELLTFAAHAAPVTALAFAPDSKRLATAGEDHVVKLWDAADGKELFTLSGHAAAVTALAFSPTTPYLASGSKDHTVRVWKVAADQQEGAPAFTFFGHQRPVTDVAFSPDGGLVASASRDGTVRIWRLRQGEEAAVHVLAGNGTAANSVAFSPDGKRLASAHEDGSVIVWDTAGGLEALSLRRQLLRADSVVFNPDGRRLIVGGPVTGGVPHAVMIWDTQPDGAERENAQRALLDADMTDASLARGRRLAARKEWAAAAADFAAARERDPDNAHLWYCHAAALLGAKDTAGYREVRAAMLKRFADATEPAVASHVLYVCVTLPASAEEGALFIAMGRTGAPAFAGNERVLAAALYRAGEYQAALDQFQLAAGKFPPRAWDCLFQAMAHHQLGRAGEARKCLDKALAWIVQADIRGAVGDRNAWISWYEAPEVGHLVQEARALIEGPVLRGDGKTP